METGAITGYIDVAQVVLYAFFLFFAGLVFYLLRENKREGYPMVSDRPRVVMLGYPRPPAPKTFLLPHGLSPVSVPRVETTAPLNAVPTARFPGAPYQPLGNPMLAAMGPGSFANRSDEPDLAWDDALPKIVPLRVAPSFFLALEDPDIIGFEVYGLDDVLAGRVAEAWIDRSEVVVRYLEIELATTDRVLIPMNFLTISAKARQVRTRFITAAQFATVPRTKHPDTVTFLEEDKIMGYYAGGVLYARAGRTEPLL